MRVRQGLTRWRTAVMSGLLLGVVSVGWPQVGSSASPPMRRAAADAEPSISWSLGGWQIDAARAEGDDGRVTLHTAEMTLPGEPSWTVTARRVELVLTAPSRGGIAMMWAFGPVRILGPDGVYVTADRLVAVSPRQRFDAFGAGAPPSAVISRPGHRPWRVAAERVRVELASRKIRLTQVGYRRGRPDG